MGSSVIDIIRNICASYALRFKHGRLIIHKINNYWKLYQELVLNGYRINTRASKGIIIVEL